MQPSLQSAPASATGRSATPILIVSCAVLASVLITLLVQKWTAPAPVAAQAADGGRRYVAVTGHYQEGVSLLYVLDQKTQHLAVYEAQGGAPNSHEVVLVGVRNISLDTQLSGYNDESDYTYKDLKKEFERRGLANPAEGDPAEGAEGGGEDGS